MKKDVFLVVFLFITLAVAWCDEADGCGMKELSESVSTEEYDLGVIDGAHFVRILDRMFNGEEHLMARELFSKTEYRVTYLDDCIASYRMVESSYVGGAHGMTTIEVGTLVAGQKNGTPLKLTDIMTETQRPQLTALIRQALRKHFKVETDAELDNCLLASPQPIDNFYYDGDGLHFVYNVYEIACFADGPIEICVQWPRPSCALQTLPGNTIEQKP